MPYNILIFVGSKPGLSPSEFKDHYEGHVRLLKFYAGDLFPKIHRRHYLRCGTDDQPTILRGDKAFFDFEAAAEIFFDNETAYQAFLDSLRTEEAREKIAADENKFSDREKLRMVVIGDIEETKK